MTDFKDKDLLGYNLKRLRKEKKLTLDELAEMLNKKYGTNFNKGMLSKWENGYSANLSSIKVLSLFYDVQLNELLGFNVKKDKNNIPVLRNKNLDKDFVDERDVIGYGALPPFMPITENAINDVFYLRVTDDFMNKEYPEGSLVLIRKNVPTNNGDDVLVKTPNNKRSILGRMEQDENFIFLIPVSNNSDHKPKIININDESIKIIGKVVAYCGIK